MNRHVELHRNESALVRLGLASHAQAARARRLTFR